MKVSPGLNVDTDRKKIEPKRIQENALMMGSWLLEEGVVIGRDAMQILLKLEKGEVETLSPHQWEWFMSFDECNIFTSVFKENRVSPSNAVYQAAIQLQKDLFYAVRALASRSRIRDLA